MVEGVSETTSFLAGFALGETGLLFTLLFFTAVIVIYSVFVYYFYKFLAKKNIIELNLSKYGEGIEAGIAKLFAVLFYIVEYLIILPVVTFFWFAVLAILILLLAEGMDASSVLLISAALVASVRVTSYVSENLSRDLAKMLPFTLIAIAITKPGFFNATALLSRFGEIPALFSNIPYYLLFIVVLELIMRIADFLGKVLTFKKRIEQEEKVIKPVTQ
jgi:hypothetical protein